MKGMLLRDLMMMRKTIWMYAIMIVCFAALKGETGAVFAMFYGIIVPVNLIAMDERSRFERMMPMLPLRGIYCVLDKYIAAWACLLLAVATGLIAKGLQGSAYTFSPLFLPGMALCLLSQAITMPLVFRFGVEKGRLIYLISIVGQAGVLGALGAVVEEQIFIPAGALNWIAFGLAAMINVGSVFLSERVYMKRLTA